MERQKEIEEVPSTQYNASNWVAKLELHYSFTLQRIKLFCHFVSVTKEGLELKTRERERKVTGELKKRERGGGKRF